MRIPLGDRETRGGLPTVLVIGGGTEALVIVRALRRLPARVLVADARPSAPAFRVGDVAMLAATHDVDSTIEAARAYASRAPIDAVVATTRPLGLTAAAVADAIGTPGPPVQAAEMLADRGATARRLDAHGVPVAATTAVDDPDALTAMVDGLAMPVVVKPVDAWGARGVVRVDPGDDASWAFRVAAAARPGGRVLAQPLVEGRALSVIALVIGDEPVLLDVCERSVEAHARFSPFFIDGGHQGPYPTIDPQRARIRAVVQDVVRVFRLRDVLVTVELRLATDGPIVVDVHIGLTCGRRLVYGVPLATGVDAVGAVVGTLTGDPPSPADLEPRWHRAVAERGCFPDPGTVVEVDRVEAVRELEGIELVDVAAPLGSRVAARTNNACRGGTILATGATPAIAADRATRAAASLRIVTCARSVA